MFGAFTYKVINIGNNFIYITNCNYYRWIIFTLKIFLLSRNFRKFREIDLFFLDNLSLMYAKSTKVRDFDKLLPFIFHECRNWSRNWYSHCILDNFYLNYWHMFSIYVWGLKLRIIKYWFLQLGLDFIDNWNVKNDPKIKWNQLIQQFPFIKK